MGAMSFYLIDHPPARSQFAARPRTASGVIVVHTAESIADTDTIDRGAEAVAAFIRGRSTPGCYHTLVDSDSIVEMVPLHLQTWGDGTGSNSHAIHLSVAAQAARWSSYPDAWVDATLENLARAAVKADRYVHGIHGVHIPAKRISRAESDRPGEGFISHGERDPGRRTDPGAGFPWQAFLAKYDRLAFGEAKPPAPTRGLELDQAMRRVNRALADLEDAKGRGARRTQIDLAEESLRQARRQLREVAYLNTQEDKTA